jgi:hypothetical protein
MMALSDLPMLSCVSTMAVRTGQSTRGTPSIFPATKLNIAATVTLAECANWTRFLPIPETKESRKELREFRATILHYQNATEA